MKKLITILACCVFSIMAQNGPQASSSIATTSSNLYLIDQVEVVIFGSEDSSIVTTSEIERPSLSGGYRSQDDIVLERLIYLDAKRHNIPDDEEAVDAYFMQIQREHNLTPKELENIFTSAGYTIEEGREQLKMMQTINTMLDIKIRSNLIVPRKDIEAYYHAHPEKIEATYTLEHAFIPFSPRMTKKKQHAQLCAYVEGKIVLDIEWSEPFMLNYSEIARDKEFIYTMESGAISQPQEVEGGFELFKLVEKTEETVKSLDDSYREIADILRRPKYEELMQKYRESLFNNAGIVYF